MNKTELISAVAEQAQMTKKATTEVVEAVFNTIMNAVVAGDDVKITGFGAFTTVERSAREGRNPLTGESIHIDASKSPKFKAGSAFKTAVKEA